LVNPIGNDDDDTHIPSDLPYACEAAYSTNVNNFTGPARVVARIPDIPQAGDIKYLTTVIENCITGKPQKRADYEKYFALSAAVWAKSTQMSLHNMFTQFTSLKLSPAFTNPTATHLKAPVHFYNCHGAHNDSNFYGEKSGKFPVALTSSRLNGRIKKGCVVAAECCYGAELVAPSLLPSPTDTSIANNYLQQNAIAFLGSSTIAYGPSDEQGLADLITQYFIINVLNGASTGRALLQARQKFLTESGPQLDPYELKTLAQFLLLGDPAVQPVIDDHDTRAVTSDTVENRRMKFAQKGADLKKNLAPALKQRSSTKSKHAGQINKLLKQAGITAKDKSSVYSVKSKSAGAATRAKMLGETDTKFRTFTKMTAGKNFNNFEVLVVKESKEQLLGWKIYVRK
jgi:DNA-binding protein H-NS